MCIFHMQTYCFRKFYENDRERKRGKSSLLIQSITNKLHKIYTTTPFILICFAVSLFNESVNIKTMTVFTSLSLFSFGRSRDSRWYACFYYIHMLFVSLLNPYPPSISKQTDVRSFWVRFPSSISLFLRALWHWHCCKYIRWISAHILCL